MDTQRKVQIICDGEPPVFLMITDDKLKKSLIKEYFPSAGNLTYKVGAETYLLQTDAEHNVLEPLIDTYYLSIRTGTVPHLNDQQLMRFNEILQKINANPNPDLKETPKQNSKFTDQKIGAKRKSNMSQGKEEFKRRVIKVELNGNKEYTLDASKQLFLQSIKDKYSEFDQYVTELDDSSVRIGRYDESIIFNFKLNGTQCGFWKYIQQYRTTGHRITLYLLTTQNPTAKPNTDEISKNSLTSRSNPYEGNDDHTLYNNNNNNVGPSYLDRNKQALLQMSNLTNIEDCNTASYHANKSTPDQSTIKSPLKNTLFNFSNDLGSRSSPTKSDGKEQSNPKNSINRTEKSPSKRSYPFNKPSTADHQNRHHREETFENVNKPSTSKVKSNSSGGSASFVALVPCSIDNLPLCNTLKGAINHNKQQITESSIRKLPIPVKTTLKDKIVRLNLSVPLIKENKITIFGEILGKGAQGIVRRGKLLGSPVAMKTMKVDNNNKIFILREIKLLDKIRHPNIISIMAVSCVENKVHIVTEYVESENLHTILHTPEIRKTYDFTTDRKIFVAHQVSCAVVFLHQLPGSSIVHRDIKPGNILVKTNFDTKLCDIGLGISTGLESHLQSAVGSVRGTYLFMAPEMIVNRKEASTYTDVWSFACTTVELFTEQQVWDIKHYFNILGELTDLFRQRSVPKLDAIPPFLQRLLKKCFN
ncbi:probable serine/threonine-protein kinase DDB_G0281745 [Copidosoma floridanum]|uniref:probable serine/threonine-protein kinase DDB_G0281745 n=1 Tax=Copidosoma floridanum TaxID=29053 RepID=UPI000C6F8C38|nr:probable serine/threonine-protein kinase DDB_G0281745 [Copidosoma floridanum]